MTLTRQDIEELFVTVVDFERLNILADYTAHHVNFVLDLLEFGQGLFLRFLDLVEIVGGLLSLRLDLVEEGEELLRVLLEHGQRARETVFLHGHVFGAVLDFFLLGSQHVLHEGHLALLGDQLPAVLTILRSLDGDVEASSLSRVDLALHLGVDSKCRRLNVGFANFTERALTDRLVLLPDLHLLVLLALDDFAILLGVLEAEYQLVRWHPERILTFITVKRIVVGTGLGYLIVVCLTHTSSVALA